MKISQADLQKIILEEYIKEEGLEESQAAQDLLRQILGDKEYERRQALKNRDSRGGDTKPMKKPNKAAETMPIPRDEDEPSPETASAPNPIKAAIDGIYDLVSDMDPEDVQDIFQIVFQKLPGVEMLSPGDEGYPEDKPPTEYVPGAMGRPQVGFKEELINKAYARIMEMAGIPYKRDDDDFDYENMSDAELIDMAERDGIEEILITDDDGDLVNREEVIAALKDV